MAVQRGVAFAFTRPTTRAVGAVVLTNDIWNARMRDVGVVLLVPPTGQTGRLTPLVCQAPPLQALPGQLLSVSQEILGAPLLDLPADQLQHIEDALCLVLGFRSLLPEPPRPPPVPSGPITYPRWGDLYYVAGQKYGGEHKRYIVVSEDRWNARARTVIAVRTTTQTKWPQSSFPAIERGTAQACCGDASSFLASRFELQRTFSPQRLSIADMHAIADGLVQTHGLYDAVDRLLGQAPAGP